MAGTSPAMTARRSLYLVGGVAEKPDQQFVGGIEGALRQIPALDTLCGTKRHFGDDIVAPLDIEVADRLPLHDRSRHRARIHDLGGDMFS